MSLMPGPLFLIMAGVRRAVAAREAGLTEFPAKVVVGGYAGPIFEVPLDSLYSPKDRVSRSDPRYQRLEQAMIDPVQKPGIPEMELVPLRATRAKYFTRLA